MNLNQYIKMKRKHQFSSIKEFREKTKLDIPESNLYYYERGSLIPKSDDLGKIINALSLNPKMTFTLWLHEHLPDASLKKYFPLPELTDEHEENLTASYNLDETIRVNKQHVDYLSKNRLARLLLTYFYINSSSASDISDIYRDFAKHDKKNILHEIKKLSDWGYLIKTSGTHYQANSKFIYTPYNKEYEPLIKETMSDIVKTSHVEDNLVTPYGTYKKGLAAFFSRTLTPEQLDYVTELFKSSYSEAKKLPSQAGQEFNICCVIGAMYEK